MCLVQSIHFGQITDQIEILSERSPQTPQFTLAYGYITDSSYKAPFSGTSLNSSRCKQNTSNTSTTHPVRLANS